MALLKRTMGEGLVVRIVVLLCESEYGLTNGHRQSRTYLLRMGCGRLCAGRLLQARIRGLFGGFCSTNGNIALFSAPNGGLPNLGKFVTNIPNQWNGLINESTRELNIEIC